jgi:hypothetical protein
MVLADELSTEPPAPLGGTIADGVYLLRNVAIHGAGTSTTPPMLQATRRFDLGNLSSAIRVQSGVTSATSGTYRTSGTELLFDQLCPAGGTTTTFGYTATPTSIMLYEQVGASLWVLTHARL